MTKLYSWNVNGIRSVWNKGALQSFIKEHDPDILCLQETKANQDQVEFDLPNYHEYWFSSARKKGYSGTAIFSKKPLLSTQEGFDVTIHNQFNFEDSFGDVSQEGRVLTGETEDFYVVNVYTPNSKDKLERLGLRHKIWDPAFLLHLKQLEQKKPVLVCGDFNVAHQPIDLARPQQNEGEHGFTCEEREGFDALVASGFADTFRHFYPTKTEAYTWWTNWGGARARNVGWRIDYWLASSLLLPQVKSAQIHPDVMGSDHCPVSVELK